MLEIKPIETKDELRGLESTRTGVSVVCHPVAHPLDQVLVKQGMLLQGLT